MYDNNQRTGFYKKDMSLENALNDINDLIDPLAIDRLSIPKKPIILIMGCARSGSTLLMQYLSSLEAFSYPSNLIARFYKNPYLGIRIQQALLEFDPLNQLEFNNIDNSIFQSNLGKTTGALAPSEFWYFWREYFKFSKYNHLNLEETSSVDSESFLKKLSSFEILTSKPLAMKGMMLNWNIPYLHSIYRKFVFINLKRDIVSNSQSLLSARKKFYGNTDKWYSFKPLEFEELIDKNPIGQVVGQVYYTQKAIEHGLKNIPNANKIDITYEDFCRNPNNLLELIKQKFVELDSIIDIPTNESISFKISKRSSLDISEIEEFKKALLTYV